MGTKIESVHSGFENIGKFYLYVLDRENLKPIHRDLYMLLVRYSFGYVKNIQYEVTVSLSKVSAKLNVSKPTIMRALQVLSDENLISRTEWQEFGPKQSYKYKVNFPHGYSIDHLKKAKVKTKVLEPSSSNSKEFNVSEWL